MAIDTIPPGLSGSARRWMIRGMFVGVLLTGSANALSFFFRSRGWGSLLGSREPYDEAIGFPLAVWEEGAGYSSHQLNTAAFAIDIAIGLGLGLLLGGVAVKSRPILNRIIASMQTADELKESNGHQDIPIQFSLSGLLITTTIAAVAAALARSFTPRVEILAAIYALGPIALVGLMFLPRGLRWQQRVGLLIPSTIVLIAVAIAVGNALNVEFDKVLMGIFICWTPQTTLAALGLTTWLMVSQYRVLPITRCG